MSATLYQAQLDVFLDPNDPAVIAEAERQGIPHAWLESAKASPIWKMAMEWKIAFPLHPEYRTLPMVWYVPPLSPITSAASAGKIGLDGEMPDVKSLRIPMKYLANLLTAGEEKPVTLALQRMLAMRAYMRAKTIDGVVDEAIAKRVGLRPAQIEEMYQIMAIANYEDRFVIPTAHRETGADAFEMRGSCGFTFGNGCSGGESRGQPVRFAAQGKEPDGDGVMKTFKVLSALLGYPDRGADRGAPGFGAVLATRKILPPAQCRAVEALVDEIAGGDLYELQERYGLLFDRSKTLAVVHLFEHVHGESRDRGQAMVDLKTHVRGGGPDHRGERVAGLRAVVPGISVDPAARRRARIVGAAGAYFRGAGRTARPPAIELQGGVRCAGCDRGEQPRSARSSSRC